LILRRETHLDQLADKFREERVQRVIEPILYAEEKPENILDDDILYVRDLGLIGLNDLTISNPIYVSTHKLSGGHYPNFILKYYKKLSKI